MLNGKFWLIALFLVGLLIGSTTSAFAVSAQDVVRLKQKIAAGETLTVAERLLADEAKRELGSLFSVPRSTDRPRQPGHNLDEYDWSEIPYEWVDISEVGQPSGISFDDHLVGPFDLGFSVNFYDISYTSVYMCSNGWANFVGNSSAYWNQPIPDGFDPNAAIYAFWDDLYPPMGGEYYYYQDTANDRFILSWIDVPHISDNSELYTFQIIINSSGTIQINYNSIADGGIGNSSCTCGVENETSSEALQICDNGSGDLPESEWSVLIVLPDGIPNPVTNLAGTVVDHDVTFTWVDPTHDTNGNPVTLTNIEVFMGPPAEGNLQATVLPGVQTVTLEDVADGMRQFFVRATADPYAGSASMVQLLIGSPSYANDFNTNDGQWTSVDGWTWGEVTNQLGPQPHSEPYCWGSNMEAPYPDLAEYNLYLDLGLAVGSEDAYMEFYIYYDMEFFWDGCNVKVSLDGGDTWEIATPETPYPCPELNQSQNVMTGEPCWSGQSVGWEHVVIPLGPYNGEAPIFRFQAASDEVVSGYGGAFIDDMIIWGMTEPVFATVSGHVFLDGGVGNVQSTVVRANGYGAPSASPAANGDFTINNVIVGDRRLTASLAGYNTTQIEVDVPEGGATGANITLVRVDPPAPTNVAGSVNNATGAVSISWTNSADPLVDTYYIYRRLAGDENFVQVGTDATSPYNETLTADGIYQYRVVAVDLNVSTPVQSPPSLMVTVLFGELPVPQLGASGDYDDRIRLSWLTPGTLEGTELGYDDGTAEFYFLINWPSGPTDYYAVRFSTPDDAVFPLLVYSANLFVQNDAAIPWIGICPTLDGFDAPDLDNPFVDWEGLTADGSPGWVTAETEGALFLEEAGDFWVVMQIPPGVGENQTACGTDDSAPDGRTYYAWQPPTFNPVTWSDGIMRVWLGGPPPAAGAAGSSVPDYYMLSSGGPTGYAVERVPSIPVNHNVQQPIRAKDFASSKMRGPVRNAPTNIASPIDRWFKPYVEVPELELVTRDPGHALDDILNYRVYRNGVMIAEPTATNYFDTGRTENVNYNYHVTAYYDNLQESPPSPTRTAMCNMAPAAPTNLTGAPIGNTQMRLTWSAPTTNDDGTPLTDLALYNVYRGANLIGTVAAGTTQYIDTPPQNDGYYSWTVTAQDEIPNVSDPAAAFTGAVVSPWEEVDYEWVDISQVGEQIQIDWWGDISNPIDLGFNFPFMGEEYNQVWISGMGWVTFIEVFNGFFSNEDIPNNFEPHAAIYPFWDELYPEPTMGAQVLYYADQAEDRFIISWIDVPHLFNTGVIYSFQLILGSDGSAIMNYNTIPVDWPANGDCTVGVEDATSSTAIQLYSFGVGEFAPATETAVAFWAGPSGTITGLVREFGSNAPVADASITVAQHPEFFATSDVTGLYLLEIEPGTYTINIHKQGYCDQQVANIVVVDDGTVTQGFSLRQPNTQFDVTSLNVLSVTGQNATAQFEISNPGATCEVEYSITTNQTWLTVNPATGEVPSNNSTIINVTGATANFNPGDYTANISVTHNDVASPFIIPVTISVASPADDGVELPTEFALRANYPNPFNATTVLNFDVPQESHVELVVFNVQGQEVARPVDRLMAAGRHSINYAADGLPSGMYLVKMTAGGFTAVQKIVLLK